MTLGGLDEGEHHAIGLGGVEVDGALVVRDVDALGLRRTGLQRRSRGDRGRHESEEGGHGELHVGRWVFGE